MTRTIPELLAPAGSGEKLATVLRYGADAVYLGGKAFNLRAQSSNFSMPELAEAIRYVHALGKKVYVTLNIIAHERDIKALPKFIQFLDEHKADAVIVADIGVMTLVREHSSIPIHISTQASTTNYLAVKTYYNMGAKRVVLARELGLTEIRKIRDKVPEMELEVFVHGSMCMAYSGRCQLSSYFTERDSNHGLCANTCRWKYSVVEETRPGEYFPVYEDETGSYIFNSKDLCTIEFIDQIIEAGVDGLKIEGRHKGLLYAATTVKVYREALEAYRSGTYQYDPSWKQELESYTHRGYTSGFFHGNLPNDAHATKSGGYKKVKDFLGVITAKTGEGSYEITLRNRLKLPQEIEILTQKGENQVFRLESMQRVDNGEALFVAHNGTKVLIKSDIELAVGDIARQDLESSDSATKECNVVEHNP